MRKSGTSDQSVSDAWSNVASEYGDLIQDANSDSGFLRSQGLQPTLVRLIGDCQNANVLDIGCGTGWLIDAIHPKESFECDLIRHASLPTRRNFKEADICELPYASDSMDITVASLVLIWCESIDRALSEMYRVTKPGGRAVISIMHPYFYRTGIAQTNGDFVVAEVLSRPFTRPDHKIAGKTGPLTYYYRPLPDYVNGCISVGFQISHVEDWFLDLERYKRHFGNRKVSAIPRTNKVPMYSFIQCAKGKQ